MSSVRKSAYFYLTTSISTAVLVGCLCFTVNVIVDPLWYFGGNSLTGINFGFNERLSKIIFLSSRLGRYDCLIMGSSRATLLPEHLINGYRCHNLAFSGGTVTEFIMYARYLRYRGFAPSLLIVGVDDFDFEDPLPPVAVPDFVRMFKDPPSFLRTYASLDTLRFSIQTLLQISPLDRYYDGQLAGRVRSKVPVYVPPRLSANAPMHMTTASATLYAELRSIFPTARAIGYVPPISAWNVAQLEFEGNLDKYLEALNRTASIFDEFLDFGIPSAITINPENTYDGSHYSERVNQSIAASLVGGRPQAGIAWSPERFKTVSSEYRTRLHDYGLLPRGPDATRNHGGSDP